MQIVNNNIIIILAENDMCIISPIKIVSHIVNMTIKWFKFIKKFLMQIVNNNIRQKMIYMCKISPIEISMSIEWIQIHQVISNVKSQYRIRN